MKASRIKSSGLSHPLMEIHAERVESFTFSESQRIRFPASADSMECAATSYRKTLSVMFPVYSRLVSIMGSYPILVLIVRGKSRVCWCRHRDQSLEPCRPNCGQITLDLSLCDNVALHPQVI